MNRPIKANSNFKKFIPDVVMLVILAISLYFVFTYKFPEAVPEVRPTTVSTNIGDKEGFSTSIETLKSIQELITALMIGLAGLVGTTLKDGLGQPLWLRWLNAPCLSIFISSFIFVFRAAYACYGAIIEQMDKKYFLISRLEDYPVDQAQALLVASAAAILLFYTNVLLKQGKNPP